MDHQYIEGQNIPDRYLQGTLSATERARFEEHLVDCAECLDRLEMTEDFRGALRTVAAEGALMSRVPARPGLRAWLREMPGGRNAALLAAAVLLLIALPAALSIIWTGQARRQMDQARLSAADWQRKYQESEQAGRKAEAELQAREQDVVKQRREIEAQRDRERQTRVVAEGSPQARLRTAPIYDLHVVRGSPRGASAPTTRISIPRSAQWILLKLEIEPDPELQSYRATVFTSDQRVVCRASDVIAVKGVLTLSCDSSQFRAGDYRLALEGLTRQGRHASAGTYSFAVIEE